MSVLRVALTLALLSVAAAHTYLTNPAAYNREYRTFHCQDEQCTNACPDPKRRQANTRERPAKVWRRGQRVTVTYLRNTHRGGMMRLSLVPVEKMQDREWHKRLTIMHGCWESGGRRCRRGEHCGTDGRRITFDRQITIPDVYPDGNYVLGLVWYGGVKMERGEFPDWYSCSHVRIRGGNRLASFYRPYFEAGPGSEPAIRNGKCRTTSDKIGQCDRNACPERRAYYAIPKIFRLNEVTGFRPRTVEVAMRN